MMDPSDRAMLRPVSRPFLRWAGGKRRIVAHLLKHLPSDHYGTYWEPFLGAGALFFALAPKSAFVSDLNSELMACYQQVRDNCELVYKHLSEHIEKSSEEHYYHVRSIFNRSKPSPAQAARFIYLNRTSFNGIYRVNLRGQYNVPYGFKEPPPMPSLADLRLASRLLSNSVISAESCHEVDFTGRARPGDLVYLDPPYLPLNSKTANFTHYTDSRFSSEDHIRVADLANRLREEDCNVLVSNSDNEFIRDLYQGWHISTLPVVRSISAKGNRFVAAELVITSYVP